MSIPRREEPETGNGGHPDPAFAACLTGSDQQSLLDRARYLGNGKNGIDPEEDDEKKKEEEGYLLIAADMADCAAEFFYNSAEADQYANFMSGEDWLNFADQAEEDLITTPKKPS